MYCLLWLLYFLTLFVYVALEWLVGVSVGVAHIRVVPVTNLYIRMVQDEVDSGNIISGLVGSDHTYWFGPVNHLQLVLLLVPAVHAVALGGLGSHV